MRAAIDPRGDALVDWELGPQPGIAAVAFRPSAASAWGTPFGLAEVRYADFWPPAIALDKRGDGIALWARGGPDAQDARVEADTLPAGAQAWQAPVKLMTNSSSAEVPGEPTVAVGPRNEAVVAWRMRNEADQSSVALDAAVASMPRGRWRRTASIVRLNERERADGVQLGAPRIAVNARGEAIVIWEGSSGRGSPGGLQAVVGWPNRGR